MGTITFNGVSSKKVGVIIQTLPTYDFAERDVETIHVLGKSGDVVIEKGSYKNVSRTYRIAKVFENDTNFVTNATAITKWLMSARGYARLEDSYEPDYYRLAMYNSGGTMSNFFDQATAYDITFDCKPQRFLKIGDDRIKINKEGYTEIYNPTGFESYPEFILKGLNVSVEILSGDVVNPTHTFKFTAKHDTEGKECILDCDLQDYYSDAEFLNKYMEIEGSIPTLQPGYNYIKVKGERVDSLEVVPKWWTI